MSQNVSITNPIETEEFCRRFLAIRTLLTSELLDLCAEPMRTHWQEFLAIADTHLPSLAWPLLDSFFNRLSLTMIEALPQTEAEHWELLWREYSKLKAGTRLTFLDALARDKGQLLLELEQRYGALIEAVFRKAIREGRVVHVTEEELKHAFFVVLFEELPKFRRERVGAFRTWLRFKLVDVLRKYGRERREHSLEDWAESLSRENGEQRCTWDRDHAQYIVQKALEELEQDVNPRHLEIFRAIIFRDDETNLTDVAVRFGVSLANVYQIHGRLNAQLKKILERWGEDA